MSEQINEKYIKFFLDSIIEEKNTLLTTQQVVNKIDKGVINFQNKRKRLVIFPDDTPDLDIIKNNFKRTVFPIMSMDDLGTQWIQSRKGTGSMFFGISNHYYSPEYVAARALLLFDEEALLNTNPVLNIFMPERDTRVCLEAMNMLITDFKPNILKVRSVWKSLC